MKNPSVTVLLPTYNEVENIVPLIRAILKYISTNSNILIIDDDSPDGTPRVVRRFVTSQKLSKRVSCLVRKKNHGLTNSLKEGIALSRSPILLWMDADFSHPPEVIPKLLSIIENGSDVALASRMHNYGLSLFLNSICMFLFGNNITDYTTGFLAVRRTVVNKIPLRGNYGEYCIDLLVRAKRAGFRIKEIPYVSPPRRHGCSKTSLYYGFGYLMTIFKILWKSEN